MAVKRQGPGPIEVPDIDGRPLAKAATRQAEEQARLEAAPRTMAEESARQLEAELARLRT